MLRPKVMLAVLAVLMLLYKASYVAAAPAAPAAGSLPVNHTVYDCAQMDNVTGRLFDIQLNESSSALTLWNVTIRNCPYGAVRVLGGDAPFELALTDCVFENNTASGSGGEDLDGTASAVLDALTGASLLVRGGSAAGTVRLAGCRFERGNATLAAGLHVVALAGNSGASSVELQGCTFRDNAGAAAFMVSFSITSVRISGTTFQGQQDGTGLWLRDMRTSPGQGIAVDNCTFTDNASQGRGGGISLSASNLGGDVNVTGSRFLGNKALLGGAVSVSTSSATGILVLGCSFSANSALAGGAVFTSNVNLRVDGCVLRDNSANQGGAMYFRSEYSLVVRNTTFDSNVVRPGSGGGLAVSGLGAADFDDATLFSNNTADYGGAVACLQCNSITAEGTRFLDNTAGAAGAIGIDRPVYKCSFRNCTLARNRVVALLSANLTGQRDCGESSAGLGGAVCANIGAYNVSFAGSTFKDNIATTGGALYVSGLPRSAASVGVLALSDDTTLVGNQALGGAGGALYVVATHLVSAACLAPYNAQLRQLRGGNATDAPLDLLAACPSWAGNAASQGGYGDAAASGFAAVQPPPRLARQMAGVQLPSLMVQMLDGFGQPMALGSFDSSGIRVLASTLNASSAVALSGRSLNTSIDGAVYFNDLRFQGPTGNYTLAFGAAPQGKTTSTGYTIVEVLQDVGPAPGSVLPSDYMLYDCGTDPSYSGVGPPFHVMFDEGGGSLTLRNVTIRNCPDGGIKVTGPWGIKVTLINCSFENVSSASAEAAASAFAAAAADAAAAAASVFAAAAADAQGAAAALAVTSNRRRLQLALSGGGGDGGDGSTGGRIAAGSALQFEGEPILPGDAAAAGAARAARGRQRKLAEEGSMDDVVAGLAGLPLAGAPLLVEGPGAGRVRLIGCRFVGCAHPIAIVGLARLGSSSSVQALSLTVQDCVFDDNRALAAVFVNTSAVVATFSGTQFRRQSGGCGVWIHASETGAGQSLTIRNCTFQDNQGRNSLLPVAYGGGLRLTATSIGGGIYVTDTTFQNNSAQLGSDIHIGARSAAAAGARMTNSNFLYGAAEAGGSIFVTNMDLALRGCTLVGNAAIEGGAVYFRGEYTLSVQGSTFRGNGLMMARGPPVAQSSAHESSRGGALAVMTLATAFLDAATLFEGNWADYAGAALCLGCKSIQAKGTRFVGNTAKAAGAVALDQPSETCWLTNCTFADNSVPWQLAINATISEVCAIGSEGLGGAICVTLLADVELAGTTFENNTAMTGGAVFVARPTGSASSSIDPSHTLHLYDNTTFRRCAAIGGAGGGIYAEDAGVLDLPPCVDAYIQRYYSNLEAGSPPNNASTLEQECPNWSGCVATDGGYGPDGATGFVALVGPEGGIRDYASNTPIEGLVLRLRDGFMQMMGKGSYDSTGMRVAASLAATNMSLPGMGNGTASSGGGGSGNATVVVNTQPLLSGTFANSTVDGSVQFTDLRVQARPGTYNITFLVPALLRSGSLKGNDGRPITVSIQVREGCPVGHTGASGTKCDPCTVDPPTYSWNPWNVTCDDCPAMAVCRSAAGDSETSELAGAQLVPITGHWHSSPLSPRMYACATPAACTFENRSHTIALFQANLTGNGDKVWTLPPPHSAAADALIAGPSGPTAYWEVQCTQGYTGVLCGRCVHGYGSTSNGECKECPAPALNLTYYVLSYCVTIVLLFFTIRSQVSEVEGAARISAAIAAARRRAEEEAEQEEERQRQLREAEEAAREQREEEEEEEEERRRRQQQQGSGEHTPVAGGRTGSAISSFLGEQDAAHLGGFVARWRAGNHRGEMRGSGEAAPDSEAGRSSGEAATIVGDAAGGRRQRRGVQRRQRRSGEAGAGGPVSESLLHSDGAGTKAGGPVVAMTADGAGGEPVPVPAAGGVVQPGASVPAAGDDAAAAAPTAGGAAHASWLRRRAGGGGASKSGGSGDRLAAAAAAEVPAAAPAPLDQRPGSLRPSAPSLTGSAADATVDMATVMGLKAKTQAAAAAAATAAATPPGAAGARDGRQGLGPPLERAPGHEGTEGTEGERPAMDHISAVKIIVKILISYLQVSTVLRNIDLVYPPAITKLFDVGSQVSSVVGGVVSLDCNLSDSWSKAMQRTIINITLPVACVIVALPIWLAVWGHASMRWKRIKAREEAEELAAQQQRHTSSLTPLPLAQQQQSLAASRRAPQGSGSSRWSLSRRSSTVRPQQQHGSMAMRGPSGLRNATYNGLSMDARWSALPQPPPPPPPPPQPPPPPPWPASQSATEDAAGTIRPPLGQGKGESRQLPVTSLLGPGPAAESRGEEEEQVQPPPAQQLQQQQQQEGGSSGPQGSGLDTPPQPAPPMQRAASGAAGSATPAPAGAGGGSLQLHSPSTVVLQPRASTRALSGDGGAGGGGVASPPPEHAPPHGGGGGGSRDAGGGGDATGDAAGSVQGSESEQQLPPVALPDYLGQRMIITVITVIFYFYPGITDEFLSLINCDRLDSEDGPYGKYAMAVGLYWSSDYSLKCYEGLHQVMVLAVSVPGIFLFSIGVPVASALWLRRAHQRGLLSTPEFESRYSFLYSDYKRSHYYWESVIMARKLFAVGVLVAASTASFIVQLQLLLAVIAAAGLVHSLQSPYHHPLFNRLEAISLAATALSLWMCSFFLINVNYAARVALTIALVGTNLAVVAYFVYCMMAELYRHAVVSLDEDGDGKVDAEEVRSFLRKKLGPVLAWMVGCAMRIAPAASRAWSRRRGASAVAAGGFAQHREREPAPQLDTSDRALQPQRVVADVPAAAGLSPTSPPPGASAAAAAAADVHAHAHAPGARAVAPLEVSPPPPPGGPDRHAEQQQQQWPAAGAADAGGGPRRASRNGSATTARHANGDLTQPPPGSSRLSSELAAPLPASGGGFGATAAAAAAVAAAGDKGPLPLLPAAASTKRSTLPPLLPPSASSSTSRPLRRLPEDGHAAAAASRLPSSSSSALPPVHPHPHPNPIPRHSATGAATGAGAGGAAAAHQLEKTGSLSPPDGASSGGVFQPLLTSYPQLPLPPLAAAPGVNPPNPRAHSFGSGPSRRSLRPSSAGEAKPVEPEPLPMPEDAGSSGGGAEPGAAGARPSGPGRSGGVPLPGAANTDSGHVAKRAQGQ